MSILEKFELQQVAPNDDYITNMLNPAVVIYPTFESTENDIYSEMMIADISVNTAVNSLEAQAANIESHEDWTMTNSEIYQVDETFTNYTMEASIMQIAVNDEGIPSFQRHDFSAVASADKKQSDKKKSSDSFLPGFTADQVLAAFK